MGEPVSETVSTRLPPELIKHMREEAEAKGVSLAALLKEMVEGHYGMEAEAGKAEKPFLTELEEALKVLGESKMKACSLRDECPFKEHGIEPSPVVCGICQVHGHTLWPISPTDYNPLQP